MHEQEWQTMNMIQRYWRFRWHGLILAWCVAVLGWGAVALQTNTYEATAQIYVSADSSMAKIWERFAAEGQYFTVSDMVRQSLLTREQLNRVMQAAGSTRASVTGEDRQKSTDSLLKRIKITSAARWNNLIRISYADRDRRNALAVVEALVSIFGDIAMRDEKADKGNAANELDDKAGSGFRIVDPPAIGSVPVAPNRSLWTALPLVAALAAGTGLAYWLSIRAPVFDNPREISSVDGLPVVGVVTHAWMAQAKSQQRHEFMMFGLGTAGLILCFAIVLMVQNLTSVS